MAIKNLLPVIRSRKQKGKKTKKTADLFATPPRSVSSRHLLLFLEAHLLGEATQTPTLTWKYSESLGSIPLLLRKEVVLDEFPSVSWFYRHDTLQRCIFVCLLASMEMILMPNCSLLYLHSNDMNSFKNEFLKKVIAINIIVIKTQMKSVSNLVIYWWT